jgi:RecJ-like exonuclease
MMRLRFFVLTIITATVLLSSLAEAHHSFTGAYNVDKTVTIKGKIFQIALRSPHSFFYIETEDSKQWAIEGAAAGQFAQQGVGKDTFKVGDVVEVTANPSRTENSTRARLIKILRPSDGKSWGFHAAETFQ